MRTVVGGGVVLIDSGGAALADGVGFVRVALV